MAEQDNPTSSAPGAAERTGYCQECGRGLSIATLRRVGSGVFCVPCALRQSSPAWQNVAGAPMPEYPAMRSARGPNPGGAAVLGLIPGVGAMYNGQYAKGALHLIVFVVLLSMADNLNWVFFWFVWGWVFYQAFDAYHTARARRDGDPLPNPFGWNEIGDRLGFGRGPAAVHPMPPVASSSSAAPYAPAPDYAPYAAPEIPSPPAAEIPIAAPASRDREAALSGSAPPLPFTYHRAENPYVDPLPTPERSAYSSRPTPPAPFAPPMSNATAPGMTVPYTPTFTGDTAPVGASIPVLPTPLTGVRRFPMGALWLIGLGTLFLFGNLEPDWHLGSRWMIPLLLAGVAAWSGVRRWEQLRALQGAEVSPAGIVGAVVGPLVLLTLAALLALDASHLLTLRRSWPALLVVWGALLTVQRASPPRSPAAPPLEFPRAVPPPPPVRSTSGTGSLGL